MCLYRKDLSERHNCFFSSVKGRMVDWLMCLCREEMLLCRLLACFIAAIIRQFSNHRIRIGKTPAKIEIRVVRNKHSGVRGSIRLTVITVIIAVSTGHKIIKNKKIFLAVFLVVYILQRKYQTIFF